MAECIFAGEKRRAEQLILAQYGLAFGTTVFETGGSPEAPIAGIGRWLRGVTNAVAGSLPPVATRGAPVLRIKPITWVGVPEAALAARN
jgi:hypothetical protein